jgi:hypothetical protein
MPGLVPNAARGGYRVNSGRPTTIRLTDAQEEAIREGVEAGQHVNAIALSVGVSSRTVVRRKAGYVTHANLPTEDQVS